MGFGRGSTVAGYALKERVTAALHSLGTKITDRKLIVNLSPSEQKKNGPIFDLPMAIGILKSIGEIKVRIPASTCFIGALSLDGTILPFDGLLAAALGAKRLGFSRLYMPYDFCDVIGHKLAKRALEIAAAGEHHVFMTGPPGCGKSLLAETLPTILPPLSNEAQQEKISLYQLAGSEYGTPEIAPFRSPHHSASSVSIIGGGQNQKLGEILLAHRGILFLDEMAEFSKETLDMLRQPIESGKVTISRTRSIVTSPASFVLIGAMKPCPCGYTGSSSHYCTCTPRQIQSYQNRISAPIRDRFDMTLSLQSVNLERDYGLMNETSEAIRNRVVKARERQYERYGREICNGRVPYEQLIKTNIPSEKVSQLLRQLVLKMKKSNRVQVKIYRLARTISDYIGEAQITEGALWEAISLNSGNACYGNERKLQTVKER